MTPEKDLHKDLCKHEGKCYKIFFKDSVTESGAIDRISAAPKIWISKSASMEHDLD